MPSISDEEEEEEEEEVEDEEEEKENEMVALGSPSATRQETPPPPSDRTQRACPNHLAGTQVQKTPYLMTDEKLGAGGFGFVYVGKHYKTGKKVALKLERPDMAQITLNIEYHYFTRIGRHPQFVRVITFTHIKDRRWGLEWNCMVMELCGPSLDAMMTRCDGHFGLATVLQLAVQCINAFDSLHHKGLLHRDIKLGNLLFGRSGGKKWYLVHIVDLGMAADFRDKNGFHRPPRTMQVHVGSNDFKSLNAHKALECSRRDDMEALGYMFVAMARGVRYLPWWDAHLRNQPLLVGTIKENTPLSELCAGLPSIFERYLKAVRALKYEARPDYLAYRNAFKDTLKRYYGLEMGSPKNQYDFDYRHQPRSLRARAKLK